MLSYDRVGVIQTGFATALRGIGVRERLFAVGDAEVRAFQPDGTPDRRWTTTAPGYSVAATADGAIYVGEEGQVEIFDSEGRLTATWRDAERMGRITAIGFADGSVLLGDAAGRAIRRYDANGRLLNDIGTDNRMKGFRIPNGVVSFAVDRAGIIHAANPGMHRVQRYTPEGELIGHFGHFDGRDPAGFQGCCNPTNVAVAGDDRVYVTEKAGPRAKVYDTEGNLLSVVAADVFDFNSKNMDLAVDSRGHVYVCDTVKLTVHVFAPRQEGVDAS